MALSEPDIPASAELESPVPVSNTISLEDSSEESDLESDELVLVRPMVNHTTFVGNMEIRPGVNSSQSSDKRIEPVGSPALVSANDVRVPPTALIKAGERAIENRGRSESVRSSVSSDVGLEPDIEEDERLELLDRQVELEDPPVEVRRSARVTAGQHNNPFNLPKSVVADQSVSVPLGPSVSTSDVLANISQTQLLMVQLLLGQNNASK